MDPKDSGMKVEYHWPTEGTVFDAARRRRPRLVVADPSVIAMTVTCYKSGQSTSTSTGQLDGRYDLGHTKPLWLFHVELPESPTEQSEFILNVSWTDDENGQGNVETAFFVLPSLAAVTTGITWPKSGNTIPSSLFRPYGPLSAFFLSSPPAPVPWDIPASGTRTASIYPRDPGTVTQNPIGTHSWCAIYSSVPSSGNPYTLKVEDSTHAPAPRPLT